MHGLLRQNKRSSVNGTRRRRNRKKAEEKEKKHAEPYAVGDEHLADLQVSVRQGKTRDQIFKAKKRDELQLVHMVVEQIEVPDKEDEKRCFI